MPEKKSIVTVGGETVAGHWADLEGFGSRRLRVVDSVAGRYTSTLHYDGASLEHFPSPKEPLAPLQSEN